MGHANSAIPTGISDVFEKLRSEITWLHVRWIIYRQLFGTSERRVELLNECAATCFHIIQNVLQDEIQMSLNKLTDPAQTKGKQNLSLEQLLNRIKALNDNDENLINSLNDKLGKLRGTCKPFRIRRDKKLAHLDLEIAMEADFNSLPRISRQMIEDALGIVRKFMNEIEIHYSGTEMAYEHFAMTSGGDALAAVLKSGLRYEQLLQTRAIIDVGWAQGPYWDA